MLNSLWENNIPIYIYIEYTHEYLTKPSLPQPQLFLFLFLCLLNMTEVAAVVTESIFSSMLCAILLTTYTPLMDEVTLQALLHKRRMVLQSYIEGGIGVLCRASNEGYMTARQPAL